MSWDVNVFQANLKDAGNYTVTVTSSVFMKM